MASFSRLAYPCNQVNKKKGKRRRDTKSVPMTMVTGTYYDVYLNLLPHYFNSYLIKMHKNSSHSISVLYISLCSFGITISSTLCFIQHTHTHTHVHGYTIMYIHTCTIQAYGPTTIMSFRNSINEPLFMAVSTSNMKANLLVKKLKTS